MARVLHLISSPAPPDAVPPDRWACFGAMLECAAKVARAGAAAESTATVDGDQHRVVLIGGAHARQQAAHAGLRVDRFVRAPLHIPLMAWTQIRQERAWRADRVLVWSPGLSRLAVLAGAEQVVLTDWARDEVPGPKAGDGNAGAASAGLHLGASAAGIDRAACRTGWGVADRDPVIALVADPPGLADVRHFVFVLGLVEVGVGPLTGVASSDASMLDRGRRFLRRSGRRSRLIVVDGPSQAWLPACDIALLHGARDGRASLGTRRAAEHALALGRVVIGPAWLADSFRTRVGVDLFLTDGQTRTILPGTMRALRRVAPWMRIDPDVLPAASGDARAGRRAGDGVSLAAIGAQQSAS